MCEFSFFVHFVYSVCVIRENSLIYQNEYIV